MTFDPNAHIIKLRGKGGVADYLPVAARIAWFRDKHADGHIAIEAHTISADVAIFHARVSIPEGGSAEGWGSETPRDFGDYIEKASTKALGRALLALGYGTMQAGEELSEGERIVDAPVEQPQRSTNQPQARSFPANNATAVRFDSTVSPAPSPGTPAPAATVRAVPAQIVFTHNPPADSPLEHPLLATIRDDEADPKARKRAVHDYYMGADSIKELDKRADSIKGVGLPQAEMTKAYNWHAERIEPTKKAPASHAG